MSVPDKFSDINFDTYGQDILRAERQRELDRKLNEMYRERMGAFRISTSKTEASITAKMHNEIVREIQKECYAKAAELVMDAGIPRTGRELEALCKKLTDLANIAPKRAML